MSPAPKFPFDDFPVDDADDDFAREPRPSGRDEMNLAEFPFALLRRQTGDEDSYTYEGWVTERGGQRRRQRWTVRGAGGLGLPTEYDERVIVALMAISAEQGFQARKTPFSIYRALQVMGLPRSQRAYESVQRALERLVGVTIYAEGAFWDQGEQGWVEMKSGFHIIEKYWLAYLERDQRVRDSEGIPGYFIWSEDIWKSIQDGYIKYLDLDFYFSLDIPLARRLYRFLDKRMHYQTTYEIDIFDLASRLGMARYEYPSEVSRKLQPALDELIEAGFLQRAGAVKVGRYTRMRFERVGTNEAKRQEAAPPAPRTTLPDAAEEAADPVALALVDLGFGRAVAQALVTEYGTDLVQEKLNYLRWEQEVRRKLLRNPRGWLRRAIEEDYGAPAGYDARWLEEMVPPALEAPEIEEELETSALLPEANGPERAIWTAVLQELEGRMTRATFQEHFPQTTLVKVQGEVAVIAVPSARVQAWLENRLHTLLSDTLSQHLGHPVELVFVRWS